MKRWRKPVDMLHNPPDGGSVRFPIGGGLLIRFGFQGFGGPGWICTINLSGQSRALYELSYGAKSCPTYNMEPRGTPSAVAPQNARNGDRMAAGAAIAPRSTQCRCVVLLLDHGPFEKVGARARSRTG